MRILGIDPGSRVAGYGIIDVVGNRMDYVTCGVIRVKTNTPFPDRLLEIHDGITQVIKNYRPEQAAIEEIFMARNPNSALKLGHARGVLILAGMQKGVSMAEYTARQVKQAVAGYGNADKKQVQHMVRIILSLLKSPSQDAADALAVAICHANHFLSGISRT
ncbi:MAG: crossover junction endodeoxyribonuclease RuvC [Proteobacteria bacterium]|nr:crossover junction endodeoxyribonuclease RuvC [Pseudomonadota bacterium]MBU1737310.1 crossover junction endodeoxyribonuclease RuvC [Pseudomonadota bacterium]